jgi:DNA repair photolyase
LSESCKAGATRAGYVLLRLPLEIRQLFEEWAQAHFPDRAARILALVRETRGGRAYDSRFGIRQTGTGAYADMLARRFQVAAARLGLGGTNARSQPLDCTQFAVPAGVRTEQRQLELL